MGEDSGGLRKDRENLSGWGLMCEVGRELGLTLKWPGYRGVVEWEEGALELTAVDESPLLAASFL